MGLSTKPHKARRRRTKDQIWQLQLQILGILSDDHPQSVRHVFYRMTDPNLAEPVEKSESGYRQVQYQITQLRRMGAIPYGWIRKIDTLDLARFVAVMREMRGSLVVATFEKRIAALEQAAEKRGADDQGPGYRR